MTASPELDVVVVAYGEAPLLGACVDAILASADVSVEVCVVDNGCTDGAVDEIEGRPGVAVLRTGRNLGFGGGCNVGAAAGRADVVAFVNPDVVVDARALAALRAAAIDAGVATAAVRLREDPQLVNSCGGAIHFLGLGWAEGFRRRAADLDPPAEAAAASGACMAIRRSLFSTIGGFTEELFLYHEDAELSWRAWLAGARVLYVPEALALHEYEFSRHARKLYFLERNRLFLVLTAFQRRTLVLLLPALVLFELGMVGLAAAGGWLPEKLRGWRWMLANRRLLRAHRRRVQRMRRVPDRALAGLLAPRFSGGQIPMPAVIRPADALLGRYWMFVRRWL